MKANKDLEKFIANMRLRAFLGKLGLTSVRLKSAALSMRDIEDASLYAMQNYGQPTHIMMSKDTYDLFAGIMKDDE